MADDLLAQRQVSDTHSIYIYRMMYNDRIVYGPTNSPVWDRGFCYPQGHPDIQQAFQQWDGTGDPPGAWIKEVGTQRHGPGLALL